MTYRSPRIKPVDLDARPEVMVLIKMGCRAYGWVVPTTPEEFGLYVAWFDNPNLFISEFCFPCDMTRAMLLGIC